MDSRVVYVTTPLYSAVGSPSQIQRQIKTSIRRILFLSVSAHVTCMFIVRKKGTNKLKKSLYFAIAKTHSLRAPMVRNGLVIMFTRKIPLVAKVTVKYLC